MSCKVSVLTPIYRTDPAILRAAIDSVLAQTFTDFELILLDDCPEDDREAVVKSYADPRIRYAKNERNLGITPSRNRLMEMAKGEYLAVFDHDDICLPDRLAEEVAYLDAHPACGVVSGWSNEIPSGDVFRYPETDHEIKVAMMGGSFLLHSAAMIRASVLKAADLRYEEDFSPCEDYRLWLRLIAHTEFHGLQKPLITYRFHAGNTTKRESGRMADRDIRCRAWAQVQYPELWAEFRLRERLVTHVRLLGLPFLKIERTERCTRVKLFDFLPVLKVKRHAGI